MPASLGSIIKMIMTTLKISQTLLLAMALLAVPLRAADAPPAKLSPADIAQLATPSVVLIKLANGLGSGFVVSNDGKIVTNLHVIRGAREATVVTADGREFKDIEVMATDAAHDLAVLRIAARDLKALPLGNSAATKPGEHVVVIGHPLGLGNTVSDGLVSAVRELLPKLTLLQISAPISPGSSGGPLFNDQGEVIGISTLVIREGQNLNFAVPINTVKPLLDVKNGISLAAYAAASASTSSRRKIPEHSLALLDNCQAAQRATIVNEIEQAIKLGAPLYNSGKIEACYRIYAAVALDLEKKVQACEGPKRALLAGVGNADKLAGWSEKAWAMRDAFDGVLSVIAKKSGDSVAEPAAPRAQRKIPHHPLTVLEGCNRTAIAQIDGNIAAAINTGGPLYNSGNVEACYRIYEGAINEIDRSVNGCAFAKQALRASLSNAQAQTDWRQKSWILRDAFDGLTNAIDRLNANQQ